MVGGSHARSLPCARPFRLVVAKRVRTQTSGPPVTSGHRSSAENTSIQPRVLLPLCLICFE